MVDVGTPTPSPSAQGLSPIAAVASGPSEVPADPQLIQEQARGAGGRLPTPAITLRGERMLVNLCTAVGIMAQMKCLAGTPVEQLAAAVVAGLLGHWPAVEELTASDFRRTSTVYALLRLRLCICSIRTPPLGHRAPRRSTRGSARSRRVLRPKARGRTQRRAPRRWLTAALPPHGGGVRPRPGQMLQMETQSRRPG